MTNAANLRAYRERKRQAGYQRLDIVLTPQAWRALRKHMKPWEPYGDAVSRLLTEADSIISRNSMRKQP